MPIRPGRGLKRSPIRCTEVSGIPCFWADAPAPFTATLVFRVGRADETLATAGITHLTEHILMPASPPRELERNARVEDTFAVFWAAGTPTRALRFLEGLVDLIAEPPLHRLETERSILKTEAAGGGAHPVSAAMALRYGAQAHGLIGYDELGLYTLRPDDISAWIGEFFTRENAALWLTAAPPRDLELNLPPGRRRAPPRAVPLEEVELPAVYPDGPDDTIIVAFDAPRSPALSMASAVLVNRAWQSIRYDRGLAYDIGDYFEAITGDVVHGTLSVESLEENVEVVRDAVLQLFRDLAEHGATEDELREELERLRDDLAEPAQLPAFLHYAACEHLLGREVSQREYLRSREEVTPDETAAAIREVLERLLIAVPNEEHVPPGMRLYPMSSARVVEGAVHRPYALAVTRELRRTSLTVGADGLTLRAGDHGPYTILFRDLAAVLHWTDGTRTLWARDGTRLLIDPDTWRKGQQLIAAVDERVPEELVVRTEPERMLVYDAVERLASEKLKRRWTVEDELKLLPEVLDVDEKVLTLAEATRGWRSGLLAVTDRRVLWLFTLFKEQRVELSYEEIEAVRVRKKFLETKLELETRDEPITFTDVGPKGRAEELEALIHERRGGG